MNFRTTIKSPLIPVNITHKHKLCTIGSCFSDTIGGKLLKSKFNTLNNPFGTLYHPHIITQVIAESIAKKEIEPHEIVVEGGVYRYYGAHSDVSGQSIEALKSNIASIRSSFVEHIRESQCVFLTYGSAYHFYHQALGMIVGNCHKQPGQLFDRRCSSITDIVSDINSAVGLIKSLNLHCQIILTVSPVRHLRDGLIENNRSKAHLLSAVHDVVQASDDVHYFPAYEMIIDDLRDYRFYASDMTHPSSTAVDYVWDHFKSTFVNDETAELIKRIDKINQALSHKPFNEQSQEHQKFLKKLRSSIETLASECHVDYKEELMLLDERITRAV